MVVNQKRGMMKFWYLIVWLGALTATAISGDVGRDEENESLEKEIINYLRAREEQENTDYKDLLSPAVISDTYLDAKRAVTGAKEDYGNGISTLVIIHNNTPETMSHYWDENYSGRFETGPPDVIPPKKYASFLHVKRSGAATGSAAGVMFTQAIANNVIAFGWDSPFMGSNSVGVKVHAISMAQTLRHDLYDVMKNHYGKGKDVSQHLHTAGTAEIIEDTSSPMVLYTLLPTGASWD